MIGLAVELRCPNCRMWLGVMAVNPPTALVIDKRRCGGRGCRSPGGGEPLYFFVQDGKAKVLTGEQLAQMKRSETQQRRTELAPAALAPVSERNRAGALTG